MLALALALLWIPASKSNEILGRDGEPIVCPDGETLKTDLDSPIEEPSQAGAREAERNLPDDKTLAFNEYTGEFEVVDSVRTERGGISMPSDPLVYECGPGNEPKVVHLSEVDPEAAAEVRRGVLRQIDDVRRHGLLKGMDGNPDKGFAAPDGS